MMLYEHRSLLLRILVLEKESSKHRGK